MKRICLRYGWLPAVWAVAAVCALCLRGGGGDGGGLVVSSPGELRDALREAQWGLLPLEGPALYDGGEALFLPSEGEDDAFLLNLFLDMADDSEDLDVIVSEDPLTRETLFHGPGGGLVWSLPPEGGYTPWWAFSLLFPDEDVSGWAAPGAFDPSLVSLRVTLTPLVFPDIPGGRAPLPDDQGGAGRGPTPGPEGQGGGDAFAAGVPEAPPAGGGPPDATRTNVADTAGATLLAAVPGGGMAIEGALSVAGDVAFEDGPPRLKALGDLSCGIYTPKTKYLVANGQACVVFDDVTDESGVWSEVDADFVVIRNNALGVSTWRGSGFCANAEGSFCDNGSGLLTLWSGVLANYPLGLNSAYRVNMRWIPVVGASGTRKVVNLYDSGGALIGTYDVTGSTGVPSQRVGAGFILFAVNLDGTPVPTSLSRIYWWADGWGFSRVSLKKKNVLVSDCVAVEKGSTKWSPTPAPSNCLWDKVTKTYRTQTFGTGSFSIVER